MYVMDPNRCVEQNHLQLWRRDIYSNSGPAPPSCSRHWRFLGHEVSAYGRISFDKYGTYNKYLDIYVGMISANPRQPPY